MYDTVHRPLINRYTHIDKERVKTVSFLRSLGPLARLLNGKLGLSIRWRVISFRTGGLLTVATAVDGDRITVKTNKECRTRALAQKRAGFETIC